MFFKVNFIDLWNDITIFDFIAWVTLASLAIFVDYCLKPGFNKERGNILNLRANLGEK